MSGSSRRQPMSYTSHGYGTPVTHKNVNIPVQHQPKGNRTVSGVSLSSTMTPKSGYSAAHTQQKGGSKSEGSLSTTIIPKSGYSAAHIQQKGASKSDGPGKTFTKGTSSQYQYASSDKQIDNKADRERYFEENAPRSLQKLCKEISSFTYKLTDDKFWQKLNMVVDEMKQTEIPKSHSSHEAASTPKPVHVGQGHITMHIPDKSHGSHESRSRQSEEIIMLNQKLKQELEEVHRRYERLKEDVKILNGTLEAERQSYEKLHNELKQEQVEKGKLLTRLSKVAGNKLADGNPNITDLNDPNRPQKLSEQFGHLYDEPWTEALESFPETHADDEQKHVGFLLDIFKRCYKHCAEISESQMKTLEMNVLQPVFSGDMQHRMNKDIATDIRRPLKEARSIGSLPSKEFILLLVKSFKKEYSQLFGYIDKNKVLLHYLMECMKLCWLCCIQDPPVVFVTDVKDGEAFNEKLFREYTRTGRRVHYLVWPAMLLHGNGPVLYRGVVQLYKEKRK